MLSHINADGGTIMEQFKLLTQKNYDFWEASSALQKSVRRGDEDGALFWATELDKSGFGEYVFKRLKIIASEDIGLAEPLLPAVLQSLYSNWVVQRKKKDSDHSERLFLVHAVVLLVRARKSRMLDHAAIVYYNNDDDLRDISDYALDKHTLRGRSMGRSFAHFFEEGAKLQNPAPLEDPYEARAKEFLLQREKRLNKTKQSFLWPEDQESCDDQEYEEGASEEKSLRHPRKDRICKEDAYNRLF